MHLEPKVAVSLLVTSGWRLFILDIYRNTKCTARGTEWRGWRGWHKKVALVNLDYTYSKILKVKGRCKFTSLLIKIHV